MYEFILFLQIKYVVPELLTIADTGVLLVSHGAPIGAIHTVLGGSWKYVGQATVSKFVKKPKGGYIKELSNDASHLTDKTNLRPW